MGSLKDIWGQALTAETTARGHSKDGRERMEIEWRAPTANLFLENIGFSSLLSPFGRTICSSPKVLLKCAVMAKEMP